VRVAGHRTDEAEKDGHIINIGSVAAHERTEGSDIYVATKGAIQAWTESLHKQVSKDGLKVSLIEPGLVGSDMTAEKVPVPEQPATIAAEKMLQAEDLAECVFYLVTQPHRVNLSLVRIEPRNPES
jgi:NADP-dependent 3-hydroxy acid dehydrogenase YdfG